MLRDKRGESAGQEYNVIRDYVYGSPPQQRTNELPREENVACNPVSNAVRAELVPGKVGRDDRAAGQHYSLWVSGRAGSVRDKRQTIAGGVNLGGFRLEELPGLIAVDRQYMRPCELT